MLFVERGGALAAAGGGWRVYAACVLQSCVYSSTLVNNIGGGIGVYLLSFASHTKFNVEHGCHDRRS